VREVVAIGRLGSPYSVWPRRHVKKEKIMDFKSSRTRTNLINAFAGESQARNRYTFFASEAKKEGYEQISAIFTDTAENEKEHAKLFYKLLVESAPVDVVQVTASFPALLGKTLENLGASVAGEHEEWTQDYIEAARIAQEEGFSKVAATFRQIAEAEKAHERRFAALKANIENGLVFRKGQKTQWRCRNCGRVVEGEEAPKACPTCQHPQSFFEVLAENY
jgi:rubrerythrin